MTAPLRRPRLGFLGVGWIGRHRLEALAASGVAEIVAIADPEPECRAAAAKVAPHAIAVDGLSELLNCELDGLVIATPSALHASQSIAALERGIAVFCQKPLGRSGAETREVIDAARAADRLLSVDFSYRYTAALQALRSVLEGGGIGRVFAANLVFHNAYGPDKPWFYDMSSSGGGCVMDLGVHLIDAILWLLDFPAVLGADSRRFRNGQALTGDSLEVEDFATATLDLEGGVAVQLSCSWRLSAGRDAVIEASLFGTEGGLAMHNVDGSFYDFVAERYRGTQRERLAAPPDEWGGRALVQFAADLAVDGSFHSTAERAAAVADVIDRLYGRQCSEDGTQ